MQEFFSCSLEPTTLLALLEGFSDFGALQDNSKHERAESKGRILVDGFFIRRGLLRLKFEKRRPTKMIVSQQELPWTYPPTRTNLPSPKRVALF